MSQIKLLKISVDGIPVEMDTANDDVTLHSYVVTGGGPTLSGTGLDLTNQDVTNISDLVFTDPSVGTINQTAGALVVNNIVAKDRSNLLTTAADILFPTVTDTSGQVDAFRLPSFPGAPTATPTASGEGFVIWDSSNDDLYVWNGTAWDNQNVVREAEAIGNKYTAAATIAARDLVYISAADSVSPALATAETTARVIGFAEASAAAAADVTVQSEGVVKGFTGLTAGSRYYLSTTAAGGIQTTVPAGTGNVVTQVGYAKSTTAMQVQIQQLGRRA